MYRTIQLSPYISVQGMVTSKRSGGQVAISVDGREFVGWPVQKAQQPEWRPANSQPEHVSDKI